MPSCFFFSVNKGNVQTQANLFYQIGKKKKGIENSCDLVLKGCFFSVDKVRLGFMIFRYIYAYFTLKFYFT